MTLNDEQNKRLTAIDYPIIFKDKSVVCDWLLWF